MTRQDKLKHIKESQFNEDYAHESSYYDWITTENGEHIPIGVGGKAADDGPAWARGRDFSKAKTSGKGTHRKDKIKRKLDSSIFPAFLSTKKADKKNTDRFIEMINKDGRASEEAIELFGSMNDLYEYGKGHAEAKIVHKSDTNGAFRPTYTYFGGYLEKMSLEYAMFDGEHDDSIMLTQAHELTHFMNTMASDKRGTVHRFTMEDKDLRNAIDEEQGKGHVSWNDDVDKMIQSRIKKSKELQEKQTKEMTELRNKIKKEWFPPDGVVSKKDVAHYNNFADAHNKAVRELDKKHQFAMDSIDPDVGELERFYDSLSKGHLSHDGKTLTGHGRSYFLEAKDRDANEMLSEYVAMSCFGGRCIEALRKDKPDLCKAFDKAMMDIARKVKKHD